MKHLFKAGDKVGSMWGDGAVKDTCNQDGTVVVQFDGFDEHFTMDGKVNEGDSYPSIWHRETGTPPSTGERPFEYPIYKKCIGDRGCDFIVKFSSLGRGSIVWTDNDNIISVCDDMYLVSHTNNRIWQDCEPPKWKPTEPTWCYAWNDERMLALITGHDGKYYKSPDYNGAEVRCFENAEPCSEDEIPQWWKDMKNAA